MKKIVLVVMLAVFILLGLLFTYQKTNKVESDQKSPQILESSLEEQVWGERIQSAFDSVECLNPSAPYFGENTYKGPMIDAHWHIANIPDNDLSETPEAEGERPLLGVNTKITDIICTLEREGTTKVFAFFPVYRQNPEQMVEVVKRTMEKYPDKFVPFIMPPDNDDSPSGFPTVDKESLQTMLYISPGLFKGYGEIGLYARGDHGGPKGAPELPPNSQRLKDIYPIVRENNLLVYFHLGEGQKEAFEETLSANQDINFIFHGDQLIPYENGIQNLEHIDDFLSNHPNVFYEVDELWGDAFILRPEVGKQEFLAHFQNYEELLDKDVETWKAFIEKHQDQVIWGTDRGWSSDWSSDEDVGLTMTSYTRAFIARLSPAVQEKYAYKNAEKLINSWE